MMPTRDEILKIGDGYEIRKLTGIYVMKWNQEGKWWIDNNRVVCSVFEWRPDEIISNAMAVLGAFELWNIYKGSEAYEVQIIISPIPITAWGPSLHLAICRAALLAVQNASPTHDLP